MKAQPGKDLLLYAGAEIVSTFIRLDLVDHYRLRIHPVVLGSGKPIFTDSHDRINLKLGQATSSQNGAVVLDYRRGNR